MASKLRWVRKALRRPSSQELWERKWATSGLQGSRAPKGVEALPAQIEEAVATGWFRVGAPLLDIGCGSGAMSAIMARNGFPTLGIDFAPSAIELARSTHARATDDLRFEVADICAHEVELGSFENVIDRGCFHCLHPADHAAYGRNVAALCVKGASFLMICGLGSVSASDRQRVVHDALGHAFEIEAVEDGGALEGLALWMRRR